jgi:hypothetical protein
LNWSTGGKLKLELQPVARLNIPEEASPYYPPRARWYSRPFSFGSAILRRLALDRFLLPREMAMAGLAASFLVPGLAVYIRGPRLWGRAALAGCGLLLLIFIIWFGYPAGNLAFGLLLSIHVSGFVYYCSPLLLEASFRFRLLFTLGTMMVLGLLIYRPMRNVVLQHWLIPLRVRGHVVIVHRLSTPPDIKRGDWVMFSQQGSEMGDAHQGGGAVRVQAGFGWGPVLAVARDRVEFSTNAILVNGEARPLLPHMPHSGTFTVPEKHWFIWTDFDIYEHGNIGEANISATMLQMATVSQTQFIGKPFKRWLWRRQITP